MSLLLVIALLVSCCLHVSTSTIQTSSAKFNVLNKVSNTVDIVSGDFTTNEVVYREISNSFSVWIYFTDICEGTLVMLDSGRNHTTVLFEISETEASYVKTTDVYDINVWCTAKGDILLHTQAGDDICVGKDDPEWLFYSDGITAQNAYIVFALVFVFSLAVTFFFCSYFTLICCRRKKDSM